MSYKLSPPSREEIESLYNQSGETISSLARYYKTSNTTVRKWLIDYNINRKTHQQASIEANNRKRNDIPSKDVLESLYKDNSIKNLEKVFLVGQETIYTWLLHYGIDVRTLKDSCSMSGKKRSDKLKPSKTELKEYYEKNKSLGFCAAHFNVSIAFIRKVMNEYNIEIINTKRSCREMELFEYCKELRPDCNWVSNDRNIISPLELDIFSSDLSFAIEYCGLYWHSEYYGGKDKRYHQKKYLSCKDKNIELLTIFENDDVDKVKRLIRHKIGNNLKKVYGRNTQCVVIDKDIANNFHKKYHMHGVVGSQIHYGLINSKNKLLMVMSMGHSRFSKKYEYELTRMTVGDVPVIGGFSKLFKHFIDDIQPNSVITFADLRFGSGKVYKYSDFEFNEITTPNYFYFNKNNIKNIYARIKFQKHKLKNYGLDYKEDLTEYQNMKNNGWDRIWDCGNAKYILYK